MLNARDCAGILTVVHTAPRVLYMRAFAPQFAGKPRGLHVRNVVTTSARSTPAPVAGGGGSDQAR